MAKLGLAVTAASLVAGCTGGAGLLGRERPDEFAVARNAPLVIPPDFALTPPAPGTVQPVGADSRAQAIEALFGGPAPRSSAEQQILGQAERDRAVQGARSVAGDPNTTVVDKGQTTSTILAVPEGSGQEARVTTPQ
ncbi:DUF3035 domain-containing protein [Allosphingosinicella sp.]|uniref:DUF3035 domain-containing protein n=1 Tax=Allosphingosinicella sp. TaxID=2823234 RepID=UPI0039C8704C